MNIEELVATLQTVAPSHLQDLLAAIGLVADELSYTKGEIDAAIQRAVIGNQYEEVRKLLAISEALHQNAEKIISFLNDNDIEEPESEEIEPSDSTEDSFPNRINYGEYAVDESVPHDLFSSVTHKKPAAFRYKGRKYNVRTWSGMLLKICELLYEENEELFVSFASDSSMQGKRTPRFSTTKTALRRPAQVKNAGIFIETNLSANKIRKSVLAMLEKYGIASDAVQIYFSKDLTALHM